MFCFSKRSEVSLHLTSMTSGPPQSAPAAPGSAITGLPASHSGLEASDYYPWSDLMKGRSSNEPGKYVLGVNLVYVLRRSLTLIDTD